MNWMPWTGLEREKTPAAGAGLGVLTGVPLGDVRRLRLPLSSGPFGLLRPMPDHSAMALSLELSYMTYTLDLKPWMEAGWTDISMQVDNRLQSGITVGESESVGSERMHALMNSWKVARARMAMMEVNPVAQILSAFRQREKSDTIKAVTMIHPTGDGHYTVAIGFMGTGSRFYDWFSNFRFALESGFHSGFYQLTDVFLQSADRILFPGTAVELGLPMLTLADILREMRAPNSRFSLWMAGHSQGAAVMQVLTHRLLCEQDVLARHMVGYGFAAPTTTAGDTGRPPAAYPLYLVHNSDDLVPRIGALKHLGLGLLYQVDDPLRDAAYGWDADPAEAALRTLAEGIMCHIEDTPTMLLSLAALCQTLIDEKTEESFKQLTEKRWSIAPLDKAFTYAGDKVKDSLTRMARYARVAYRALAGRRMDETAVVAQMEEMRPIVRELPLKKLLGELRDRYHPPHMLCRAHKQTGSYGYIVLEGCDRLRPYVWEDVPGGSPRRVMARRYVMFAPQSEQADAYPRRRVMLVHAPAHRSARDRGIGVHREQVRAGVTGGPHRHAAVLPLPQADLHRKRFPLRTHTRVHWLRRKRVPLRANIPDAGTTPVEVG